MTKLLIRNVKLEDFSQLFPLFEQLHPKKKLDKEKTRLFLRKMLSSANHCAFIAIVDGKIVGYAEIVFKMYHFAFEYTARAETLIVDENFRRLGIATKLMKKCEEKAKLKGCKTVELDSAFHRKGAHKFYEKKGFEKRGYLFWKKL